MAQTAALVRAFTALGDRDEALGEDGHAALVARLRAVAAAGRLLLAMSAPSVVPTELGSAGPRAEAGSFDTQAQGLLMARVV